MPKTARLIVGLGNPGRTYAHTRHNIGFEVVEAIAARARVPLGPWKARTVGGEGSFRARGFALAMPQTYMNLSGESVLGLVRMFGLTPADMLVVVDDLALDPGVLRLRAGGSDGGHNGLRDIAERLGTEQFPRLRVGVGRDFPRGRQADYVLMPFTADQRPLVDEALPKAAEAALCWVAEGLGTAMNRYNGWKPTPPDALPRSATSGA